MSRITSSEPRRDSSEKPSDFSNECGIKSKSRSSSKHKSSSELDESKHRKKKKKKKSKHKDSIKKRPRKKSASLKRKLLATHVSEAELNNEAFPSDSQVPDETYLPNAVASSNFFQDIVYPQLSAQTQQGVSMGHPGNNKYRGRGTWPPYHRHYYPHEKYGGSHRRSHLDDIYLPNYEDEDLEETNTSSSKSKFPRRYRWFRNNVPSRSNYRYPFHRTLSYIKRPEKSQIKSSSDETSLEENVTKVLGDSTSSCLVRDKSSTSDNKCDSVQSDGKTDVPNVEKEFPEGQCLKTDSNSINVIEETEQSVLSEEGESNASEENKEDTSSELTSSQEQTIFINMDSDEESKDFDFNDFITVDKIDTGKSYLRRTPILLDNFEVVDMDISPMKRKNDSDEDVKKSKKVKYENACLEINSDRLLNQINEVFKENKQASGRNRSASRNRFRSKSLSPPDIAKNAKSMAKSLSLDAIDRSTYQISYNFDLKTNLLLLLKDHKSNNCKEVSSNGLNSILQFLVNTKNERNNTEDVSVAEDTANQNEDVVECPTNQHNAKSDKAPVEEEITGMTNKGNSKDCESNEETEDSKVKSMEAKDCTKFEIQLTNNCNGNNRPTNILGTVKNELGAAGASLKRTNSTDSELGAKKRSIDSTEENVQSIGSSPEGKDLMESKNDEAKDLVHAQDIKKEKEICPGETADTNCDKEIVNVIQNAELVAKNVISDVQDIKKEKEISPGETVDTKCDKEIVNIIQNAELVAKNDISDAESDSTKSLGNIEEQLRSLLEGTDDEFIEEQPLRDFELPDKNDASVNSTSYKPVSNETSDVLKVLKDKSIVKVLLQRDLEHEKQKCTEDATEQGTDNSVMSSQSATNCDTDINKNNTSDYKINHVPKCDEKSCKIDVKQSEKIIDVKELSVKIVKEQFMEKAKQNKENKSSHRSDTHRDFIRHEKGLERRHKVNLKPRKNEEKTSLKEEDYCKHFIRMKSLFGSDSDSEMEEDKLNVHRKNNKHYNHNRKPEKKVEQSTEKQSKLNVCKDKKTAFIKATEKRRYSIPAGDDKHSKKPLVKDAKSDKSGSDVNLTNKPKQIQRRRETLPASFSGGSSKNYKPSKEENESVKDKPTKSSPANTTCPQNNNENICIVNALLIDPRKEFYKKRKQKKIDMISSKSKDLRKYKSHSSWKQDTTKKIISKVQPDGARDRSDHKEKTTYKNSSQQQSHSSQLPSVDQTAITDQTKSAGTDSKEQNALNIEAEIELKMKNAVDKTEELQFEHCVILPNDRFPVPERPTCCVQENDCSDRVVVLESVDVSSKIDSVKQGKSTNQEEDIIEVKPVIPIIDLTEDIIDVKTENLQKTKPTDSKPDIDSKDSLNPAETITLYRSEETVSNSLDVQATSESILSSQLLRKEMHVVKEITVISSSSTKHSSTVSTSVPTDKNPPPYCSPPPYPANISNVLSNSNTRFAVPTMQPLKASELNSNRQNIVPIPNQTSAQGNPVQQVHQNRGPQNVLVANQIRQKASNVQQNISHQNVLLTNQIRQEAFTMQQNSRPQNVSMTNQFRQEAVTVQQNSNPQNISVTNQIRDKALTIQQNSGSQNVLLANQIRQETLPVQQNSGFQNVFLNQIRQEAVTVQQTGTLQNFSSTSSNGQEGLITSRAVQQTRQSNVHQVANGSTNALRQIRVASNKLQNLARDNRQNASLYQNIALQNNKNPSVSLNNMPTRNNVHNPLSHVDDRPTPMQEIFSGDIGKLCKILANYLYSFNGLKYAQHTYLKDLHHMQRHMAWFANDEIRHFENYVTDRYAVLCETLAGHLTSLNLTVKPMMFTKLLTDHLFNELRKKMPNLTISWFYLMVECLMRPQIEKYVAVPFLRNLYGFVEHIVRNLQNTQSGASKQVSKDPLTPDQRKYLEWQIQQYNSIDLTQRRLLAEEQYKIANSNLNDIRTAQLNINNLNTHNTSIHKASNNCLQPDIQPNCNFTAHQNMMRQLQMTRPNHVEVSIPTNHTSNVNIYEKPASVSQQQGQVLPSQRLDVRSSELSSSSTSQMTALQGTNEEIPPKFEVGNDAGATSVTVKDENAKSVLTDQEIETIDLTWINDIDPHQLEEEMEHIAIKKESVKKEEEGGEVVLNEDLFAVAPSPADSGISSPPIQVEYDETLFSDRSCICGKVAEYVCKCMLVMYCSGTCQMEDWSSHRDVCNKQKRSQQGRAN